jgi:hypothetical protein
MEREMKMKWNTAPALQASIQGPGTTALIGAGFGLMSFAVRRRTKRDKPHV